MSLELVSARAVSPSADARVFRVAVLGRCIAALVMGALASGLAAVALGWFVDRTPGAGALAAGWCAAWLGLFAWVFALDARKAMASDAWLAVVAPQALFVKWRSYQNVAREPDELDAFRVPFANVARARSIVRQWLMPASRGGTRATTHRLVELTLRGVDVRELERGLALERAGRTRAGAKKKSHWRHFPVSIEPDGTLRIEWHARGSASEFLDALARHGVPIGDAEASRVDVVHGATPDQLSELARRGDVVGVMNVLRATQGLDLTQARAKARELVEHA